jgi:hypothetical protein
MDPKPEDTLITGSSIFIPEPTVLSSPELALQAQTASKAAGKRTMLQLRIRVDDSSQNALPIPSASPVSETSPTTPGTSKRRRTLPAKLLDAKGDNKPVPLARAPRNAVSTPSKPSIGLKRPRGRPPLSGRGRASPRSNSRYAGRFTRSRPAPRMGVSASGPMGLPSGIAF